MAAMTTLHYLPLATLLLAARLSLSFAELSGENVCHKRETYTVTMRVIVKEPVQVKSYTWCLRVPPRCTKYKIEMRDKFKIQTEIRERVVDVCCAGYGLDGTQTHCIPVCGPCLHGVCSTPQTCVCEPGYTGQHCDDECREGFWGAACEQECRCQNGATCNHITGDCKCADGWRGISCEVPCSKGSYGQACMNECKCPTNNSENSTCHPVTGECENTDSLSPEEKRVYNEQHPNHSTTVLPKAEAETTTKPSQIETGNKTTGSTDSSVVNVNSESESESDGDKGGTTITTIGSTQTNVENNATLQPTSGEGGSVASTEVSIQNTEQHTSVTDVITTTQIPTIPTTTVLPTTTEARKQIPSVFLDNSTTSTPTFQEGSPSAIQPDNEKDRTTGSDVLSPTLTTDTLNDDLEDEISREPGKEEQETTNPVITEETEKTEIQKTTTPEENEHTKKTEEPSTSTSEQTESTLKDYGPPSTSSDKTEQTEEEEVSNTINSEETELSGESETTNAAKDDDRDAAKDDDRDAAKDDDRDAAKDDDRDAAKDDDRDAGTTEPQNIQIPPRRVIVISDGLIEQRPGEDKTENSKDGVWDLVSSVSVAGGVAFALIVMAAVTLLISHRRNKAKLSISEGQTSFRRQQEQLPSVPGPQMYNYTEDVQTLPLRHLFPDVAFRPEDESPCPDGLQLRFGNVTTSTTTNNNIGHPYQSFNNSRAYLELQYDIPPSSVNSKTNSLQPEMESEHLYDEIPCWRSNTTASTNTDIDASRC